MDSLQPLLVEVPICAFRPYASREYQDSFPVPGPSSVYGMLLSLLGVRREDKACHRGAEMVLGLEELPKRSKVFRKLRRGDELSDLRPDYQDLLMELRLWVWVRLGADPGRPPLAERVGEALRHPETISRFGGLSLGESSYLVDAISLGKPPPEKLLFVMPDARGFYSLPVWVDHLDSRQTILARFRVTEPLPVPEALPWAWLRIGVSDATAAPGQS
jgi:CRISPR-associated protein Cas5t